MRWFALVWLLLLPMPALSGPQDAWTVDPKTSSLTFSASQVGSIVSGRFPTWTGEIVRAFAGFMREILVQLDDDRKQMQSCTIVFRCKYFYVESAKQTDENSPPIYRWDRVYRTRQAPEGAKQSRLTNSFVPPPGLEIASPSFTHS